MAMEAQKEHVQRPWGQNNRGTQRIVNGKQRFKVTLRSSKARTHGSRSAVPCRHPGKPQPRHLTANPASAPGLLNCPPNGESCF